MLGLFGVVELFVDNVLDFPAVLLVVLEVVIMGNLSSIGTNGETLSVALDNLFDAAVEPSSFFGVIEGVTLLPTDTELDVPPGITEDAVVRNAPSDLLRFASDLVFEAFVTPFWYSASFVRKTECRRNGVLGTETYRGAKV